jgi:hypothetical protein
VLLGLGQVSFNNRGSSPSDGLLLSGVLCHWAV